MTTAAFSRWWKYCYYY